MTSNRWMKWIFQANTQNLIASLMIGLNPGLYCVLTSLGAGGGDTSSDVKMQNVVNTVLYVVFFVGGFVGGSVLKVIGPRLALAAGSIGYPVFAGGLWYFTRSGEYGYPVFGGALLGISACLLWTAVGYVATSYATEAEKGTFISTQYWTLGAFSTLGSLIAFAINFHASVQRCPDAVYAVFICLGTFSALLPLFFTKKPLNVIRSDGTPAANMSGKLSTKALVKGQMDLLKDWRMIVMVIPFFSGEPFLAVTSTINAQHFDIRTRSLNTVLFNVSQIVGSVGIKTILDGTRLGHRKRRGFIAIAILLVLVIAGWGGMIAWLAAYGDPLTDSTIAFLFDWLDHPFGSYCVINILHGTIMAVYQVLALWIAASLTNDPDILAGYAGYAKGWLAGGLAVIFGIEASGWSQIRISIFCFVLQVAGLLCMLVICTLCIKQTSNASLDADRRDRQEDLETSQAAA